MEATYSDNENGGAFKKNVIPELTELAQANEDFSGKSKKLNGGYAMPGATWTMGAMFAQTSGLPLSISIDDNAILKNMAIMISWIIIMRLKMDGFQKIIKSGGDMKTKNYLSLQKIN